MNKKTKDMETLLFKLGVFKLRLDIYLASGQTLTMYCRSYESTKLSGSKGNREISIKGCKHSWTIDVDQIVAITAKNQWF